jgi:hypothetical protein
VNVGEEIMFAVSMGSAKGTDFVRFSFELEIPEGMEYKHGSGKVTIDFFQATVTYSGSRPSFWDAKLSETEEGGKTRLLFLGVASKEYYNGAGVTIATFVCVAADAGNKTVTLKEAGLYSGGDKPGKMLSSVTPAVITVQQPG